MSNYRIAIGQFCPVIGDQEKNRSKILELADKALNQRAKLFLLPELCLSGYLLQDQGFACGLCADDAFLDPIRDLSRKIVIVIGLVEKSADHRYFNSAFFYEGGELKHIHRKVYLPTYGVFDEKRFFTEGERIQAFDSSFGRTGLAVCNDMWHPAVPYILAMDGANLILVPSASPTRGVSQDDVSDNTRVWTLLLSHTAKAYSCYVAYANLVGYQDGLNFWGMSRLVGPNGRNIMEAGMSDEELIFADLSHEALRRERVYSPLRRDERLLLTYHELSRIVQNKF
ncbi:MAG: carbon-nitrogen hydrolase [bacterium]|nr:carbon-nitrogen hydrolase [bacterium]